MLKFFRKYQKLILVVGGCLLMIVFLLPQLPQMMGGGRNTVLATMGEVKVRYVDYQRAQQELTILQSIHPALAITVASEPGDDSPDADLWIMRTYEAEKNGLVGGPRDGSTFMDEAAVQMARSQSSYMPFVQAEYQQLMADGADLSQWNYMDSVQRAITQARDFHRDRMLAGYDALTARYGSEMVDRTLSKARGIMRLFRLYSGTTTMSLPEARLYAATIYDEVIADGAIIPASSVGPQPEDYTSQQVEAHFETYKNVDAADNEFGIGYRMQPSVKVEWLKLERGPIQGEIKVDEIELRKLFIENKANYGTQTFEQSRAILESSFRRQEADRIMDSVIKSIRTAIHRNEANASASDWRPIPLSDLADIAEQTLEQDYGMNTIRPLVFVSDDLWKDQQDLQTLGGNRGGLGSAYLPQGNGRVTFAELAMNTQELGDVPNPRLGVKERMVYQPIQDGVGNIYFFRIIKARPEGPPDSAADVEDQIRRDLAMLDGYEMLVQRADEIRARVLADGMDAALESEKDVQPVTDAAMRRDGGDIGFNFEPLRTAVMDRVAGWDPMVELSEVPMAERTVVMPVPQARGLVVLQIQKRLPMTLENFRAGLENNLILQERLNELAAGVTKSAFSHDVMAERLDFERRNRSDEEEEEG
ncbi:MAG: hypothetical protein KDA21_14585 [Phycisphaerales bacterium]|nr:hypothetical protein [Phycisphaerales bacterium]